MKYFHGEHKNRTYFEGWYFKHQNGNSAIAFIPGYHIRDNGDKSAFIQVILPENSFNFEFPPNQFAAERDRLNIQIADNRFSESGIKINLKNDRISSRGELGYDRLTPLKRDAMGPFSVVPFMQCNHGVVSLSHSISGSLEINGRRTDFSGGGGYIETDWGSSFPKSYLWAQLNGIGGSPFSVMVSIADIPFAGLSFRGCIACVLYGGRQYRLATYNGVKIMKYEQNAVALKRGRYRLEIDVYPDNAQPLLAPDNGGMVREIRESVRCRARVKFYIDNRLVLNETSDQAGFEYVE
mgnify:CR=1 FL=1